MTKQYAKLSQNENLESTSYLVKPGENGRTTKRSCCFSLFIIFAVFVMLCGGIAIIVGVFFTPQVNTIIDNYWPSEGNNGTGNHTMTKATVNPTVTTGTVNQIVTKGIGVEIPILHNLSLATVPPTMPPVLPVANATVEPPQALGNGTVTVTSTEVKDDYEDEDVESEEASTTPAPTTPPPKHKKRPHSTTPSPTNAASTETTLKKDAAEEELSSWMARLQGFLEKRAGIQISPDVLVPLFMLFCFFASLGVASCCCCIMMKRRAHHRRRLLGKMITDLQTGDSRSILLDQDGDDV